MLELIDITAEVPEQIQETRTGFYLNKKLYFIEKDRCKTYWDILHWTLHLTGKNWVDRDLLREFIEKASAAAGLHVR